MRIPLVFVGWLIWINCGLQNLTIRNKTYVLHVSRLKSFHIYRYKQTTRRVPEVGSLGTAINTTHWVLRNTLLPSVNNFLTHRRGRRKNQQRFNPQESIITHKTVPGPVPIITGYFFFDFELMSLFCFFPVTDFTEEEMPPMETSSRLSVSDSSSLKSGSQENCPWK